MRRNRTTIMLTMAALWLLLLVAAGMFGLTLIKGLTLVDVFSTTVAGVKVALTLRFDALSAPIFFMVAVLGVAIGHYGIRYLDGEARQGYFYRFLLAIILSVSTLVLSNNLLMFFLMWVLTSYNLHKLLVFYPNRPNAIAAARKKQVISHLGDVALFIAICLTFWFFGTSDLSQLFQSAVSIAGTSNATVVINVIGLLLVLGAITKSAQVPFHLWLPETMETPTPVSALMHAGIINAGGFLIIRFSPILETATLAHSLLIIIGAVTAVYGALTMITQNNIKKKLAFSTISQMGIMMFACGLGAYGIALFHIIAHSFYKAHAFLSTGNLIEESKKVGLKLNAPPNILTIGVIALGLVIIWTGSYVAQGTYIALFAYAAVMLLSLAQNTFRVPDLRFNRARVFGVIAVTMVIAILAYAALETSITTALSGTIPSLQATSSLTLSNLPFVYAAFLMFAAGFWLSGQLMNPRSAFLKRTYLYLWNGGYASQWSSRLLAKVFPNSHVTN